MYSLPLVADDEFKRAAEALQVLEHRKKKAATSRRAPQASTSQPPTNPRVAALLHPSLDCPSSLSTSSITANGPQDTAVHGQGGLVLSPAARGRPRGQGRARSTSYVVAQQPHHRTVTAGTQSPSLGSPVVAPPRRRSSRFAGSQT
jgi:hypothetical protein